MSGTIDDEVFQQEEVQTLVAHPSPSAGDASPRQASDLDDIARRESEARPGNKPIASSSRKSMALRRGRASRTMRLLLRKAPRVH